MLNIILILIKFGGSARGNRFAIVDEHVDLSHDDMLNLLLDYCLKFEIDLSKIEKRPIFNPEAELGTPPEWIDIHNVIYEILHNRRFKAIQHPAIQKEIENLDDITQYVKQIMMPISGDLNHAFNNRACEDAIKALETLCRTSKFTKCDQKYDFAFLSKLLDIMNNEQAKETPNLQSIANIQALIKVLIQNRLAIIENIPSSDIPEYIKKLLRDVELIDLALIEKTLQTSTDAELKKMITTGNGENQDKFKPFEDSDIEYSKFEILNMLRGNNDTLLGAGRDLSGKILSFAYPNNVPNKPIESSEDGCNYSNLAEKTYNTGIVNTIKSIVEKRSPSK
jgi:hypothetical protein